jgi:outer membrane protein assembly factor BamB
MRTFSRLNLMAAIISLLAAPSLAADWSQFRGPAGLGVSDEPSVPTQWSSSDKVTWKVALPGPGSSSPMVAGGRVYITCYSGYAVDPDIGDQKNLRRHLLCFDRRGGRPLWSKEFEPKLPEHQYQGEGSYHGYAASTPATDGERLYVFFGKSGVYCFDLDGRELWRTSVGEGTHGWGSGTSPVLFGNLVFINASVESGSLVALDKRTGKEVWKTGGIRSSWNTPLLVPSQQPKELVVSIEGRLLGFDPNNGGPLWNADGIHRYVCPSVVSHDDVVYAIGGGHTSLAVRIGGRGDVTQTHTLWRKQKGSNVSSPVYHDGHLYWASDNGGYICCQNATDGETVYQERLEPRPDKIWSSGVLAGGSLYFVSQHTGTYVVAAKPKFELVAHNVFADDDSRTNASPAVSDGQIFLRTDRSLYCIGKK